MTIKERIRKLRQLHNIKTELDLLVMILAELGYENPEEQAKKEKYNFSKMLNGERKIKHEFVVPLQKIFNVSIDYITSGQVEDVQKSYASRGLEHTVASGSVNEYIKLGKLIDKNAPALIQLIQKIAARFCIPVTEKAVAQAIPVISAGIGAMLNDIFIAHFQEMAHGHFTVRRLERKYGKDIVERTYNSFHKPK